MIDFEIIKEMVMERLSGKSYGEIQEGIKERYGQSFGAKTIEKYISTAISQAAVLPSEDGEILSPVDQSEVIQTLVKQKAEKIEFILGQIETIITNMSNYKDKTMQWLDRLELDTQNYYSMLKQKNPDLSLTHINKFQDTIARTRNLIAADINEYCKVLDMYLKLVELTKPSEIKINNVDISLMINQEITKIEKLDYFMVKPKTPEAKETLKSLESQGYITIFKKL